ncbi:hypothetical protein ASPZODRAFT_1286731 [Penicilliopsis zonata CBS 506.65]|uniref:NADPH-dependent FMN reductase-like domain-containing protein n=1 Tax=Penicilliopsis zonata CBS 506.65 TaxID=1073090 RepID=A0A1L9S697_9EURO|nr:hypothetical protein ASPZODRAFT_1286731 [Penicilliopsis zonata CBS 506.65]OJJ42680.1 hypothetical protein ASPZODRAFT_1286731 [Penicilliopsis zonata CBS 506.65]
MKIGLIVCSQRKPRAGLQISQLVLQSIQSLQTADVSIEPIDLAEWQLPLCDEPGIPSQIGSAREYVHEHTRRWSAEISRFDGFVFVTPQYNWGYPAGVKNAIDYLFNEWKGKVGMVVSYGGHGGGKAAEQLVQVLRGVRMKPVERTVGLTFPSREFLARAAAGEELSLEGVWEGEMEEVKRLFIEMVNTTK